MFTANCEKLADYHNYMLSDTLVSMLDNWF